MKAPTRIVVLGAAGQARDVAWLLSEINASRSAAETYELVGFLVSDLDRLTPRDSRERVLGDTSWLERNVEHVDALVLGIGSPGARLRVADELAARFPQLRWPSLVHPRVEIDRASLQLGVGCMIGAGAVGSVNISLDDYAVVNLGVTLGHEAALGRGVVVNHNAAIAGGVEVADGALVGSSAAVLQYLKVGAGARVGAGAVVTKDVPAGETWVGVPARPIDRRV